MVNLMIKIYCLPHVCLGVEAMVEMGNQEFFELRINLLMALLIYLIHKAEHR